MSKLPTITQPQAEILSILAEGLHRLDEIATRSGWAKSTVSNRLNALRQFGLAEFEKRCWRGICYSHWDRTEAAERGQYRVSDKPIIPPKADGGDLAARIRAATRARLEMFAEGRWPRDPDLVKARFDEFAGRIDAIIEGERNRRVGA